MPTTIEYALMAGASYISTRGELTRFLRLQDGLNNFRFEAKTTQRDSKPPTSSTATSPWQQATTARRPWRLPSFSSRSKQTPSE
jgi:hypothetical protein